MNPDMMLIHAPSVYDFRERDDILSAYLSNSDCMHVSLIFEMPRVGILAIQEHRQRCGFAVRFYNIASQMLPHAQSSVEEFFSRVYAKCLGVDLLWLAHGLGALGLARIHKELHASARTVVGGIAATYYHGELVTYPQIDYVTRIGLPRRTAASVREAVDHCEHLLNKYKG